MEYAKLAASPKFWLFSAVSAVIGFSSAAQAQEQAQAPNAVADVVVTAQRRAQSVQDVPIAVSAFTADALRERQVSDVSELSNLTPNITLDASTPFSGSAAVLAASIRGIGQNDFAFNFDPGVGVYLDGVYLARSVGANTDLLDVERIEVLKGPQGTLFGRNAIGGAISIVTRDPGDDFGYTADVTTGSFNRFDVRGSVDLPFTDTLRASVSFSSKHRDGYVERIALPQSLIAPGIPDCAASPTTCTYIVDDIHAFPAVKYDSADREGGQGEFNVRTKFVWEAASNFTARVALDYTKVDTTAVPNTLIEATNAQGFFASLPNSPPFQNFGAFYNACLTTPNSATTTYTFFPTGGTNNIALLCGARGAAGVPLDPRYFRLNIPGGFANAAGVGANVDGDPTNNRLPWDGRYVTGDIDTSYATGLNFTELAQWGGAVTLDWELAPNVSVKSITAYRRLSWGSGMDLDGSPLPQLNISFRMHQHQVSQELQLNGSLWEDRFDYVLGAYYFEEEGDLHDLVTFHSGLLQVDGPNDLKTSAWAIFGHTNFKITEQLGLTLGLRYTEEDKSFQGFQADTNGFNYKQSNCYPPSFVIFPGFTCQNANFFPIASDPLRFYPEPMPDRSFHNLAPRVGLEYHVTDDHMLYASWARGFKTGSWTTRLSVPVNNVDDPSLVFGPEKADSIEVGLKSEFFDHAMRLNTAIFRTEYEGIQLSQFVGISPTFANAGDAEMTGGEIELQAVLGNGLSINSSLGYIHAEYTDVEAGVNPAVNTSTTELPKTPEWSFNLAPQWEIGMENGASILLGADYTYRSHVFNDTENNAAIARPEVSLVNVSATYRSQDERWELGVGGTNVTDERYIVNGVVQPAGGWNYGTYNPPAQWYVRLRVRS